MDKRAGKYQVENSSEDQSQLVEKAPSRPPEAEESVKFLSKSATRAGRNQLTAGSTIGELGMELMNATFQVSGGRTPGFVKVQEDMQCKTFNSTHVTFK